MLNRIRIYSTEKIQVRAFCLTVFMPKQYHRNEFDKSNRCSLPCLPGDPDYIRWPRPAFQTEQWLCEERARRIVGLAINALLDVPGVTKVRQFDYELQLTKAAAFDWSDCQDAIVETIKARLFADIANVDVQDRSEKQQQSQAQAA
jgi:hypothetical protein